MGIWGNPAATKIFFYSSWGVHLHLVHPPAYATEFSMIMFERA